MKSPAILLVWSLGITAILAAEPKVIPAGVNPESVTKAFGGDYYVTVMNQATPGDGTVCKIVGDKLEVFATGLDEPKGIAFVGNHLVTTDQKKVWKIDAKGQKTVLAEEKDFPHPVSFLNDTAVALEGDGQGVYISDMGSNTKMRGPDGQLWPLDSEGAKALPATGRIYHITLDGKVSVAVDANAAMPCPNGVSMPAKGTLLVGEFFTGNLLEISGDQIKTVATGYRGADAIERDSKGNLYVSSWTQGKVWKVEAGTGKSTVLIEGLKTAADFYLDEAAGQIVLPDMRGGTITFLPLK